MTISTNHPEFDGCTYLGTQTVFFTDHRIGRSEIVPVHHYRDNANGELVLAAEHRHEELLDKLMASGAHGSKEIRK